MYKLFTLEDLWNCDVFASYSRIATCISLSQTKISGIVMFLHHTQESPTFQVGAMLYPVPPAPTTGLSLSHARVSQMPLHPASLWSTYILVMYIGK